MAQEQSIQTFRERYIAVYRPNKKTYSILEFINNGSFWRRLLLPELQGPITLRTSAIPHAPVQINTTYGNTDPEQRVKCVASGQYLRWGDYDVAIVQKKRESIPFRDTVFAYEFTCTTTAPETPGTRPLWTLYAPVAAPVNTVYAHVSTIKIEPLPKRIAWIIAEDASKKEETCSITLEPISPITASVTTCYHVFDTDALATWLLTKNTCPLCKQKTVATVAFDRPKDEDDTALRLISHVTYPDVIHLPVEQLS
jgi:hypothetical protein